MQCPPNSPSPKPVNGLPLPENQPEGIFTKHIAEDDPNSALGGMPVIQVWNAKHVLFMKRSMASGYAGVDNPTFYVEPTDMFLGDAKENLDKLVEKFRNK